MMMMMYKYIMALMAVYRTPKAQTITNYANAGYLASHFVDVIMTTGPSIYTLPALEHIRQLHASSGPTPLCLGQTLRVYTCVSRVLCYSSLYRGISLSLWCHSIYGQMCVLCVYMTGAECRLTPKRITPYLPYVRIYLYDSGPSRSLSLDVAKFRQLVSYLASVETQPLKISPLPLDHVPPVTAESAGSEPEASASGGNVESRNEFEKEYETLESYDEGLESKTFGETRARADKELQVQGGPVHTRVKKAHVLPDEIVTCENGIHVQQRASGALSLGARVGQWKEPFPSLIYPSSESSDYSRDDDDDDDLSKFY